MNFLISVWYFLMPMLTSSLTDVTARVLCEDSRQFTDLWREWQVAITTEQSIRTDSLIYGDLNTCPRVLNLGPFSPESDRSSCPWFYVNNVVSYRLPEVIPEAKCNCSRCFGVMGDSYCQEQMIDVPVLYCIPDRRGNCVARLEMERISVGCSCFYPRTLQSIR